MPIDEVGVDEVGVDEVGVSRNAAFASCMLLDVLRNGSIDAFFEKMADRKLSSSSSLGG